MKHGIEFHLVYLIVFALLIVPASLLIQLAALLQHSPAINVSVHFPVSYNDVSPDPVHCTQLSSKPLTKSTPFRLAFLCCSPPLSFMPDMKPNPDATEVI